MRRAARTIEVVLSNSFGFGGTNASLVFRAAAVSRVSTGRADHAMSHS